jgi:hypothetical protein
MQVLALNGRKVLRMKRLGIPIALAAVAAMVLSALAAGPADVPPATGAPPRTLSPTGFAGSSETTISGLVVDASGRPLGDVSVKLYIGGLLTDEIKTSSDGSFELVNLIDYGRDDTIDLWFVPPDASLVMENVLLRESSSAVKNALYSRCIPRVPLDPITDVVVKLVDLSTKIRMLEKSSCLG